jgi:hypothetical protein
VFVEEFMFSSMPNAFTASAGMVLKSTVISDAITVGGINAAASINITGGTYNVNGGTQREPISNRSQPVLFMNTRYV